MLLKPSSMYTSHYILYLPMMYILLCVGVESIQCAFSKQSIHSFGIPYVHKYSIDSFCKTVEHQKISLNQLDFLRGEREWEHMLNKINSLTLELLRCSYLERFHEHC